MTEKKFGIGATPTNKTTEEDTSSLKEEKKEESSTISNPFGVKATKKRPSSFIHSLGNLFTLQTKTFWLVHYGLALLFLFYKIENKPYLYQLQPELKRPLYIATLLFPFAVTALKELGSVVFKKSAGKTSYILFGFGKETFLRDGAMMKGIVYVCRAVVLYYTWQYSILLGIIGLVYMLYHARYID